MTNVGREGTGIFRERCEDFRRDAKGIDDSVLADCTQIFALGNCRGMSWRSTGGRTGMGKQNV